jgi:hypothetical protein
MTCWLNLMRYSANNNPLFEIKGSYVAHVLSDTEAEKTLKKMDKRSNIEVN